jgi:hypothetical protein
LVVGALVMSLLLTEPLGRDAGRVRLVRDVMVWPTGHEGQVTRRKLQRSARVFEP